MTNPKENTDLREQDDKYRRAFEAATDLYKIDGELPGELAVAISHLRQFINEECSPKDQVTSQLIYDLLYPTIEKLVHQARVDAVERYKITDRIERLDIQCLEGDCKNCDSKRPLLAELNRKLKELESKEESNA